MPGFQLAVTFFKFALVGALGLCITLAITHVLTDYLHLWYFLSFLIATFIAWTFVFFANAIFSFRDIHAKLTLERFGAFFLGYLSFFWISAGIVYTLTSLIGVPYVLSIVAGTVTTTILTFLFSKFVVFTKGEKISLEPLKESLRRVPFSSWALIGIILIAFMLRLPGVHYGLPLHLVADEEVNIYAALKMLELKTLFPVMHPDAFVPLLYAPPMTAYLNVLLFVPTIALTYFAWGFPEMSLFKDMLLVDTSVFFFVARVATIFFSLLNIYLVYRISRNFLINQSAALFAAFFLATSFLDVTISNTARHWTLGIFFSLLALLIVLEALSRERKHRLQLLVAAGFVTGLSFGTSYLVYYLPFFGLYMLFRLLEENGFKWKNALREIVVSLLSFGVPFAIVSLIMIALAPYAFEYQVLTPGTQSAWKSASEFFTYYLGTLWNFETPILIFAAIGYARLYFAKKELFGVIGALLMAALILMYLFLNYLTRYVVPLLPILSILAGYGLYECIRYLSYRKAAIAVLVGCFVFYFGAVYGKYIVLASHNDTRYQAKTWLEENVSLGSTVIMNSDDIRLQGTPRSLALQESVDASSLRSFDRAIMSSPELSMHPFDLYNLYFLSPEKGDELLKKIDVQRAYIVTDAWAKTHASQKRLPREEELRRFEGTDRTGAPDLLIGGDYTGHGSHILEILYGASNLGPDVVVYMPPL